LADELNPRVRGRRFEQFVIGQLIALAHYQRRDVQFYYWRTNHGAEVDLLLCRGIEILAALEIKSSRNITMQSLSGLRSFRKSHPDVPAYVLSDGGSQRLLAEGVTVIAWDEFIGNIFAGLL
jgi:predicted AAA+ superfamily ATPase